MVKINANSYTPVNNESIPTGNLDLLIYSIYLSNYIMLVWKFSFFETHFFPEITLRNDQNDKGYCMIQKKTWRFLNTLVAPKFMLSKNCRCALYHFILSILSY